MFFVAQYPMMFCCERISYSLILHGISFAFCISYCFFGDLLFVGGSLSAWRPKSPSGDVRMPEFGDQWFK